MYYEGSRVRGPPDDWLDLFFCISVFSLHSARSHLFPFPSLHSVRSYQILVFLVFFPAILFRVTVLRNTEARAAGKKAGGGGDACRPPTPDRHKPEKVESA